MPRRPPDTVAEDDEAPLWTRPLRPPPPRTTDLYGAYGESLANDAVRLEKTRAIAFRHAELSAHKRRLAVARDTSATSSAVREFVACESRTRRGRELDPSVVRRKALNPETTTCMFGDVDFMHYHSSGSADWLEGLGAFESSAGSSGSGGDRDSNIWQHFRALSPPSDTRKGRVGVGEKGEGRGGGRGNDRGGRDADAQRRLTDEWVGSSNPPPGPSRRPLDRGRQLSAAQPIRGGGGYRQQETRLVNNRAEWVGLVNGRVTGKKGETPLTVFPKV